MLLLGLISLMPALRVEPPQDLMHFDNLDFNGIGSICQDMTTILAWRKTIEGIKHIQIMRFSDAGLPMWSQPLTLPIEGGYYLESSSDAFFVVMVSNATLKAYKYSLSGAPIWPATGIDLIPGNSLMPYEVTLFPDDTGGLWLISNSQSSVMPRHYAAVQRLDANGNVVFGNGDIIFGGGDDCYYRDGIRLSDNSIMISIAFRDANTLVRIAPDGSELYRGDFANTQPALEYSSLAALSGTKVIYTVGRRDFADVYVFNVEGATTLQNSFSLDLDAGAAKYVDVIALSASEAVICTMNYATSSLVMTRISETGDLLYQRTMHDQSDNPAIRYILHPAGNGECYIIYNYGENYLGLQMEKISSDGSTLWERYFHSSENFSGRRPDFLSECLSGVFKAYWMDYRLDASGIYYQSLDASGTALFPDGGVPLVTGSRGYILDSNVLPMGQSAIVATLYQKDTWTPSILHLTMIDPTPDSSWPADGIDVMTGEYITDMKTLKAGDDILVLWLEGLPNYAAGQLKAQLVSAEGQLMWGPEGIDVYSGNLRSYFGTIIDGSIFVAWQTMVGDIYCQKVLGGMLQWPRISLYHAQEGQDPDILYDFTGGYVILTGYNGTRVLRLSSDGSIQAAFGNQGLLVSSSFSSYASGRCLENHLILTHAQSSSYPTPINTIVISPDANILFSGEPQYNSGYFRSYLKSGFLYTARYENGLEISKYNMASDCLWTKQLPVYVPYDGFINGAIEALTDSSFTLLFYTGPTSYTMHYYVFDAQGNSTMANPEVLYSSPLSLSRKHAIAEDGIFLLYRDYDNRQWLKLQKVAVESQEQSGDGLTPPPQIVLNHPYPNPFKGSATIQFYLKEASFARVSLYNLKGQRVKDIHAGVLPSGIDSIIWDGYDSKGQACAPGIYFVRLEALGKVVHTRLIKLK